MKVRPRLVLDATLIETEQQAEEMKIQVTGRPDGFQRPNIGDYVIAGGPHGSFICHGATFDDVYEMVEKPLSGGTMVRAKFKVAEVRQVSVSTSKQGDDGKWIPCEEVQEWVKLTPAQGPGNETWSKWTPAGSIEMAITNPAAVAQFELGKHYFVDFKPATEPEPSVGAEGSEAR